MCQFEHIVRLLIALAQNSNSQYELKYSLNDVFMKLVRQFKIVSSSGGGGGEAKRHSTLRNLNLAFLNHLARNDLFSASELSSLLIRLFETLPSPQTTPTPTASSSSSSSSSMSSSSANSSPTSTIAASIVVQQHQQPNLLTVDEQDLRCELVYRPWLRLFSLELFKANHLFRERVVDYMLNLVNQVWEIKLFLH